MAGNVERFKKYRVVSRWQILKSWLELQSEARQPCCLQFHIHLPLWQSDNTHMWCESYLTCFVQMYVYMVGNLWYIHINISEVCRIANCQNCILANGLRSHKQQLVIHFWAHGCPRWSPHVVNKVAFKVSENPVLQCTLLTPARRACCSCRSEGLRLRATF